VNKGLERFIQEKVLELVKDGIGVNFHNKRVIKDPDIGVCSGFFDGESKSLQVAVKRPQSEWIPIFIHEYSHYRQWKENCREWRNSDKIWDKINLWSWLAEDEEYTPTQLKKCKLITQQLEQDCDKRAVALIDEFGLPINRDLYIQSSNAYILFYNICVDQRKWYKKSPYSDSRINSQMPKKFIGEKAFNKVPTKFNNLVIKEFLD
jgi:hypothetical protein